MKRIVVSFAIFLFASARFLLQAQTNALLINEIMVANLDQYVDPSWNYGSWVEIYNPKYALCDIKGYWISDDPNNLQKIRISQSTIVYGHSYHTLWFEHWVESCPTQIDMKLDADGGTIYLSDRQGVLITSATYPPSIPRSSWARVSLTSDEWAYTSKPTPSAENNQTNFFTKRLEAPEPNHESTLFDESLTVKVPIPEGATLRYTTDGTTPTSEHGSISSDGNFIVTNSTTYRFAFFQKGMMSSPVVTRSFLKRDKDFSLPILSLVTNPDNLYSDEMGIFVKGVNGRTGFCQTTPCNWNMDWHRAVNIDFIDISGQSLLNQEAEIKRCGRCSRSYTPYSFKIHASKKFEHINSLDYPFFKDKPFNKHKTLQIRNDVAGLECNGRCKDSFLQKLVLTSGIDIDAQDYMPVVHYINGVYKGTINVREPSNDKFVYSNYGMDEDEIDFYENNDDSCFLICNGTSEAFDRWYELSKTASKASSYMEIEKLVDIEEYCNYMAIEFYLGNSDWPNNNIKGWRPISDDGRFRHILFDLDFAFYYDYPFISVEDKLWKTYSGTLQETKPTTIFINMLENADFRRQFIDAFCLVSGSVFEPERCKQLITEWANHLAPMQILPDNGYNRNQSPWQSATPIINRLNERGPHMLKQLMEYQRLQLGNATPQNLRLSSNLSDAQLMMNNHIVPTRTFNGYVFPPVTIKAEAPEGYIFDGWLRKDTYAKESVYIKSGDTWTYYDQGQLTSNSWKLLGYGTSKWKNGQAPLGYGNASSGYQTQLDYGNDASSKYRTYYFRKTFSLPSAPSEHDEDSFILNYTIDDGFVVYVNGQEAGRYNMPEGDVGYESLASTSVGTNPHSDSMEISSSLFKKGVNIIAVEVHNVSDNSSDIYWDASLTYVEKSSEDGKYVSHTPEFVVPQENMELVAHFSKTSPVPSQGGVICPVVINEVSAGNSIYVSEYYKKADWVELYNMTDEDIDLAGMYLSDDADNPRKYCIAPASTDSGQATSAGTRLLAHGFRIIWCDSRTPISQLHASFKLANEEDACVVLTAANGSWADTLVYAIHEGRESIGRFPDGGKEIYRMPITTPGKANAMNWLTAHDNGRKASDNGEGNDVVAPLIASDGGMSISCRQRTLHLRNEDETEVVLALYTTAGVCVMRQTLPMGQEQCTVGLPLLRPGTYIATARDAVGRQCSTKFTILR